MTQTYRGTREELLERVRSLPQMLSGGIPDPTGTVESILKAIGVEALTVVKSAFVVKSRGGTDEAGISWPPLDPKTVAYHRRHPALSRRRAYAARVGRAARPLLSASLDKLWRAIFAREVARLRGQGEANAEGQAAALAWAIVKRRGGRTIIGEYGSAKVDIGRDTGRLLASLSPGSPDCILDAGNGAVTVGTNVSYADKFARRRPLWPDDPERFPDAWKERFGRILEDGLAELARRMTEGRA